MANFFVVIALVFVPILAHADTCLGPSFTSKVYTTSEASLSTKTVVVVEFTLTCKNGLKNVNLYADVNDRTLPATRSQDGTKYQVSWSDSHNKLPKGTYSVRLFDDEGYAALRKVQRSKEDTTTVKPLFTIDVQHQGAWKGPIVQSEFLAATIAIFVWYLAFSAKSKLQE
ncbi:translocon-associated protein subunit delta-like [Lineus longissimus]|uniref:translocon-associated protein subunit delta-like n=1 Tax=Lineus longissimus TaxID=88925 RepID=UPI00315DB84D